MRRTSFSLARSRPVTLLLALATACDRPSPRPPTTDSNSPPSVTTTQAAPASWCANLPRPENETFERVPVPGTWHVVYRVEPGVFAIVEPRQFQEAISYLVVGTERALLFDSGIGLVPLKPVVDALTSLPVVVLNSHTHFDHVGANHEFSDIRGLDTPFSRENEQGRPHAAIAEEVAPDAFCGAPPVGADTAGFRARGWTVTRRVVPGDRVDLGGRTLTIMAAPGHTPDAIVLHDAANGLLWTGDSFYESTLWLFTPGTDLAAYERTMQQLASLAPTLRRLLPAHNTISANPARLVDVARAFAILRQGGGTRSAEGSDRELVTVGDVRFMVRKP
jgi:glyoxylase-like metal-dependent hydrolase (beta-lactamase superfamily II)